MHVNGSVRIIRFSAQGEMKRRNTEEITNVEISSQDVLRVTVCVFHHSISFCLVELLVKNTQAAASQN